jgi:hypothetical protein
MTSAELKKQWPKLNERRCDLIEKKHTKPLTSAETEELSVLQHMADYMIRLVAELPIKELEAIRDDLKARGIWEGD